MRAKSPDRFLVVSHKRVNRFVQFAAGEQPGCVLAEAVSNKFLSTKQRLATKTVAALKDRGWKSPVKKHSNHWRVYEAGTSSEVLRPLPSGPCTACSGT
jgi:hypothetical protein